MKRKATISISDGDAQDLFAKHDADETEFQKVRAAKILDEVFTPGPP